MAISELDFSARERHFLDHLAPVWRAIPEQYRGTFFVGTQLVRDHARDLGIGPTEIGWPRRIRGYGPIVCAAWGDAHVAQRTRRKIVLLEHGAGQSYGSSRHTSYAGGRGREGVELFLFPNEAAAKRNRRFYPSSKSIVVGSPRVEELAKIPSPTGPPTVALSFHWRCTVAPETYTALDDFAPELEKARIDLEAAGVRLLGHAHPRIFTEAQRLYRAAGIVTVESFEDVVRHAHVYAVDNSSTLFEFAALDRPVVVLNARQYRRDVEHGLRFWTEASVGLNADPGELSSTLLAALEDPVDVARSRRDVSDRVYPYRDGTSAARAAEELVSLIRGKCAICGVAACSCSSSGPTSVTATSDRSRREARRMSGLKTYPNPDAPGSFLRLNDRDADRLGILGTDVGRVAPTAPPAPVSSAPLEPVDDPRATTPNEPSPKSATAERTPQSPSRGVPKGALPPGGPTARARRTQARTEEPAAEPEGAPDAPDVDPEPGDKKRPAPSSARRRRRVEGSPST